MKISRIFILGLSLFAFASCGQDADFEEEYKVQTEEIIPFNFTVKFADGGQGNSRRNIRANGWSEGWGTALAYYKWKEGDQIAVVVPDAPAEYEGVNYQRGVYRITKATIGGSWSTTEELVKVQGNLGFASGRGDQVHRVYYGYPAGKVNVTNYGKWYSGEDGQGERLSCDFSCTIDATQNGTVEPFEPGLGESETTAKYQVGDWNQAVCAGAMGVKPNDILSGTSLLVWPMFTTGEFDITAPTGGCTIKSIELTAHPIIGGEEVQTNICGTAYGTFTCKAGGEMEFQPFVTSGGESGAKQDKLTLSINGTSGQALQAGEKLRASMFFFPCGDSTVSSGRDVVPMNLTVKITYNTGSEDAIKTGKLNNVNVRLGGRNHIDLGTMGL